MLPKLECVAFCIHGPAMAALLAPGDEASLGSCSLFLAVSTVSAVYGGIRRLSIPGSRVVDGYKTRDGQMWKLSLRALKMRLGVRSIVIGRSQSI